MIDGRRGRGGQDAKDAAAWHALRELRRAQVHERAGGDWKRPRAETLTLDDGLSLFGAAAGVGHRAIPTILDYALHHVLGGESLRLTLKLLSEADAMQRLWLDRRLRHSSVWGRRAQRQLTPRHARRAVGHLPKAAWWLFAMAPDGYLRERALGELERDGDVMSLTHLLIRTLDWVGEVRSRAIAVWTASLPEVSTEQLLPLTSLVAHLASGTWQERAKYNTNLFVRLDPLVVRQFSDRFEGTHGEAVLVSAVRKAGARQARASFDLLSAERPLAQSALEAALRSRDVTVQRRAFARALGDDTLRRPAIDLGLQSVFAEMRVQALDQVAATPEGKDFLRKALFDKSETVRSFARFHFKRAGGEPATAYREALGRPDDTSRLVAAILGLAALERDWMPAADHLTDTRTRIRAAAAVAIGRSDPEVAHETLPPLIGDPSTAVSSAAFKGLDRAGRLSIEDLSGYLDDPRGHVWRSAARLLHRSGVWEWLLGALRLARSEDQDRSCAGIAQLRRWSARPYVPHHGPPPELVEKLAAAAVDVGVFPRLVLESFTRFDLPLPEFHDLLAGSNEDVDVTARDVAAALEVRLVKRHSGRRAGLHWASWPEPERYTIRETVIVQRNRDSDHLTEPEFIEWPSLVYVLTTTRRLKRATSLSAARLVVLRETRSHT